MEWNKIKAERKSLHIKMTLFVTSAVLIVSAAVLMVVAVREYRNYEALLQDRISDDLSSISRIMEQRLLRVEETTATMATLASQVIPDKRKTDSLLYKSLAAINDVHGVSLVFDKDYIRCGGGYYERYAVLTSSGVIDLGDVVNGAELENDPDWQNCYVNGNSSWGEQENYYSGSNPIISYFVPLCDKNGKRVGSAYSGVLDSYLTSFVTRYKARKDIDISIFKPNGAMVVAPDDYILELSPDDLIIRETTINHIGWKVVLSGDKKVVQAKVREALVSMLLLFVLMFIVIYFVIRLTVRYVAEPFERKQNLIEQEKAVMENEMVLAAGAQNELVPHVFPPFPQRKGIDLAACLHPARMVGGDLYDYFMLGDKLFFCIGDVSGKGVQASLFMSAAHYLFRSLAPGRALSDAVRQMNVSLCADNVKCRFITMWGGCLDLSSGELEFVNAGHDSPIIVRGGGTETFPASENMPLGVWEEEEYISRKVTLQPGDILLLYTDGVTEAMDANGHEFGRETLFETVRNKPCGNAADLVESVLSAVKQHSYGVDQSDDITMLCLKFIEKETNRK